MYNTSYTELGKENGKTQTENWHDIKEFYRQEKSEIQNCTKINRYAC